MKPVHRNRRLGIVALFAALVIAGAYLLLSALKDNTQFFHNPSGVLAPGFIAKSEHIRIGGLVEMDSIVKDGSLTTLFTVHDFDNPNGLPDQLAVSYTGILPDLFREGEGAVLTGAMQGGVFIATEVLAKHDNNYRPKLPESGK
ncbi:MAG: cytochrome c maturation protein CcmE [Robiginitomaculum sp.]